MHTCVPSRALCKHGSATSTCYKNIMEENQNRCKENTLNMETCPAHPMPTCTERCPCLPARSVFSSDKATTAVCVWSQGYTPERPRARLAGGPAAFAGAFAFETVRGFPGALALALPLAAALPAAGAAAASEAAATDEVATAAASPTTASAGPRAAAGDADAADAAATPAGGSTVSGTPKAAAARTTAAMVGRDQASVAKASAKAAANI